MKKAYVVFGQLIIVMVMLPLVCTGQLLDVKLRVTVNDEQGSPIREAQVICCFSKPVDNKDPWKGQTSDKVQAVTDYNGKVIAKGTSMHEMTVVSRKEGYYESRENLYNLKLNREKRQWLPYEREVKLVLRKIVNPIPMYAWNMRRMDYPVGTNVWVGYDMLRAEWMPPHGKGETEDVRFHVWSANGYERGQPADIMTVRFMGADIACQAAISAQYYDNTVAAGHPFSGWNLQEGSDNGGMGYDKQHYSHSREFRSNIAAESEFWKRVFSTCKFQRPK